MNIFFLVGVLIWGVAFADTTFDAAKKHEDALIACHNSMLPRTSKHSECNSKANADAISESLAICATVYNLPTPVTLEQCRAARKAQVDAKHEAAFKKQNPGQ